MMVNKPFWNVKYFEFNSDNIRDYNILAAEEETIKKLKKKYKNDKEEFSMALRSHFMYHYWSKCEWEMMIYVDEVNHKAFARPLVCRKDKEPERINVSDDANFDWVAFAKQHIQSQIFKDGAKIDVFDQLAYKWDDFVEYCWSIHYKYERRA